LAETAKAVETAGMKNPPIQVQRASIRADLSATADLAIKMLGGLDILITALDTPFYAPFDATDDTAVDRVMEDNFKSVWMACQEFGRVMLQRGGGTIVIISNVLAERGVPNATLYCASKGAVRNLVRALALEVFTLSGGSGLARVDFFIGGERVLVNELNTMPGFTSTSVFASLFEASGIGYSELLERLVHLALDRYAAERRYRH